MKQVIQLDAAGYYVGVTVADESPLEPGVYLLPGNAVDVPAPTIPDNHTARLDNGAWVFEEIVTVEENQPQPTGNDQGETVYSCSPWQIRKALNALCLRQQIEDAVAASEVAEIRDGWEFASVFRSDDPFVIGMGSAIGKTDTEVAEIIQYASTL